MHLALISPLLLPLLALMTAVRVVLARMSPFPSQPPHFNLSPSFPFPKLIFFGPEPDGFTFYQADWLGQTLTCPITMDKFGEWQPCQSSNASMHWVAQIQSAVQTPGKPFTFGIEIDMQANTVGGTQ